jgi:hypothetical protein
LSPQDQLIYEENKVRESIKTLFEQNPDQLPPEVLYLLEKKLLKNGRFFKSELEIQLEKDQAREKERFKRRQLRA